MLQKDTIIANESLKGITDEQISAIETLSKNDEDAVIGAKFGEVYRQMDATIEKATGVRRNGDEKTYLYLERAAKEYANKYSDYDSLKTKVTDLEDKISKGGDAALKAELERTKGELESSKTAFNTFKSTFDKEKGDYEKRLKDYKIDSAIQSAKEGFTFKQGYPESVMNTLMGQAIANVKSKNPTLEERDGVSTLVFHDAEGKPLLSAENKLNPYTAKELLRKEFEAMEILENKPTKGAGGKPSQPTAGALSGAATQMEADEAISQMLLEKGITKTSLKYKAEYDRIWEENKISDLPLK